MHSLIYKVVDYKRNLRLFDKKSDIFTFFAIFLVKSFTSRKIYNKNPPMSNQHLTIVARCPKKLVDTIVTSLEFTLIVLIALINFVGNEIYGRDLCL